MTEYVEKSVIKSYLKRAIFGADQKIDKWVDQMPAADVRESIYGRWRGERMKHLLTGEIRKARICSVCGAGWFRYDLSDGVVDVCPKYCPNCGAQMDKVSG